MDITGYDPVASVFTDYQRPVLGPDELPAVIRLPRLVTAEEPHQRSMPETPVSLNSGKVNIAGRIRTGIPHTVLT